MLLLNYKLLKLKLRVFLAGHTVVVVTYCLTEMIATCSTMIGQFFDAMIVASSNKEGFSDASNSNCWILLSHLKSW